VIRIATRLLERVQICSWCRTDFIGAKRGQKFCCWPHNNIAKSVRRKARLRGARVGEPVSLWTIYERDAGRCGICLERVDRSVRWPNQAAASLDHIIPISRGGTDEAGNLQLAHLRCNLSKGNRVAA
jgi:5-methylcytosine-specific restriction endonuclease McrA